jgi:hypothetical protein
MGANRTFDNPLAREVQDHLILLYQRSNSRAATAPGDHHRESNLEERGVRSHPQKPISKTPGIEPRKHNKRRGKGANRRRNEELAPQSGIEPASSPGYCPL